MEVKTAPSDSRHILCCGSFVDLTGIFPKTDVKSPVLSIFNTPVVAHSSQKTACRQYPATDVAVNFCCLFASFEPVSLYDGALLQSRPNLIRVYTICHVVKNPATAVFITISVFFPQSRQNALHHCCRKAYAQYVL